MPKQTNGYVTWPKLLTATGILVGLFIAIAGVAWAGYDGHERRLDDQSTHAAVMIERVKNVQQKQDDLDKKISGIEDTVNANHDALICIKTHLNIKE